MTSLSFYENDLTKIVHGSSLDLLPQLPDESIDLVFADPPYNIGKRFGPFVDSWPTEQEYVDWCFQWLSLAIAKLKPSGSLYVMTSTQAMPYLDIWLRNKMTVMSRVIWQYDSSGLQARKHYGSMYEPILFCVKNPHNYTFNAKAIEVEARTGSVRKLIDYRKSIPAVYNSTKVPGNAWYFPRVRYRMAEYEDHPSQKPEALIERIIAASTAPGDVILDPFSGTFTTCAVAQSMQRKSIGVEINLEYVKVGLRRLGLATTFNDEVLQPINKTYTRHNGGGAHSPLSEPDTDQIPGLFDA